MGSKYNPFHHQKVYCKTTFFPMLCSRPSIKDVVKLPNWKEASSSVCNDPLSPRISCMGKVKRNNRVAGLPTPHNKLVLSASSITFKYSELKRFFSARNLPSSAGGKRRRKPYDVGGSGPNKNCKTLSIVDLDPPLPVIKQEARQRGVVDSLWKRRSNGIALQSLKLQTNQGFLDNHLKPTTTI